MRLSYFTLAAATAVLLAGCAGSAAAVDLGLDRTQAAYEAQQHSEFTYEAPTTAAARMVEETVATVEADISKLKDAEYVREHFLEVSIGESQYILPIKAGDIRSPYKVVTQSGSEIVDDTSNEFFNIVDENGEDIANCGVINPYEKPVPVEDLFIVTISVCDDASDIITCGGLTTQSSTDPARTAIGDSYTYYGNYDFTQAYDLPGYYFVYGSGEISSITVGLFEPDQTRFAAQLQGDSEGQSRHLTKGIPDRVIQSLGEDHFTLKYYVETR